MRHAANTHAVDLNTGGIMCATRYVDVVATASPYLTCCRCWRALRRHGIDVDDVITRRQLPKAYLVTGLRMVREEAR